MGQDPRIVLVNPPFHRLMGSHYNGIPHGLLSIGTVLQEKGFDALVYNADYENRSDYLDQVGRFRKYEQYLETYGNTNHYIWEETVDTILSLGPSHVGFTMSTATFRAVSILAEKIKQQASEVTIIVGGVHPTIALVETMTNKDFDFAIVGEGEEALVKFLSGHLHQSINGLAYRERGIINYIPKLPIEDLDSLPVPNRELIVNPHENTEFGHIITGRGCPYACTYCASPVIWGRHQARLRSVDNVMFEIQDICDRYPGSPIYFDDDTFTFNETRVRELCQWIIRDYPGIKWQCHTRADCINLSLAEAMKAAGCTTIKIGVESGSDKILRSIRKRVTKDGIRYAAEAIKESGISLTVFLMAGFPDETDDDLKETIAFARELKANYYNLSIVTPYYGTEMFNHWRRHLPSNHWEYFHQSPKMAFNNQLSPDLVEEFLGLNG